MDDIEQFQQRIKEVTNWRTVKPPKIVTDTSDIERGTGNYRWIDFDLNQHVPDFDVWSMGNILSYVVGQGIHSFHTIMKGSEVSDQIKNWLNYILMHFANKPQAAYDTMEQLLDDYREMLAVDFPISDDNTGRQPAGSDQ